MLKKMKRYARVLSIAGSDSGGGAGIQADLKTIAACGGYGMTAITAVTAQNTQGVLGIMGLPVDIIAQQLVATVEDIGVDAIKIGMLHSSEIIELITDLTDRFRLPNIVLDPVMVATSGDPLLQEDALGSLKSQLIPKATIITPNLPEAALLLGTKLGREDMEQGAQDLANQFQVSVLLKGGHLSGKTVQDVLFNYTTGQATIFEGEYVLTKNTHGTGCTLSSAIATFLAKGQTLEASAEAAIHYTRTTIRAGRLYEIGHGHGPVHHFFACWDD